MQALKILYAAAALATGLSFAGTAFALNPQPEPPNKLAITDWTQKSLQKSLTWKQINEINQLNQAKLPPTPCKSARVCRY